MLLLSIVLACKATKFVPKDKYLLKKNKLEIHGGSIGKDEVSSIIRQQPNSEVLQVKFNLMFYNSIDSTKVANKRFRKNKKIRRINAARLAEQDSINKYRIEKARSEGKEYYERKVIPLKDTLQPSLFLREWLKYNVGEEPAIFDSLLFNKSIDQIGIFLKKKGYYYSSSSGKVRYKRNRKAVVSYDITTGKRYVIDSVYIDTLQSKYVNQTVMANYKKFIENPSNSLIGKPFDTYYLDNYRDRLGRFMRDHALYEYSPSLINFVDVDTNKTTMKVSMGIQFVERRVVSEQNPDSLQIKKYQTTYIKEVFFHLPDSNAFVGNFRDSVESKGLRLNGKYLPTLDTLFYDQLKIKGTNEPATNRTAYFLYNGELILEPGLLEVQSMLEKGDSITESDIERTYSRIQQMDLFQTIKIEIKEIPDTPMVEVHYYLIPSKKQAFSFQPRVTTTNGFLGLSVGLNYTNKNILKKAYKMTFGINGGFQAQPPIYADEEESKDLKTVTTNFYQFEIGPSIKQEFPGLFPFKKTKFNKARLGKTELSSAFSYQHRDVFSKKIFQLNYLWKFSASKSQNIQMGLPFMSVIKFINIKKEADFQSKLDELNDVFLNNTYSNQFVWEDWKFVYEYRNANKLFKRHAGTFYYSGTFDMAGNVLSAFRKFQKQDTIGTFIGHYRVFDQVYSQFARLDNEAIYSHPIGKTRSVNLRGLAGIGVPYDNSKTSMTYDYSFYAGGSNDVRGWKARALGPGSYKYYLDTNRTAIQVGDIRISGSAEYRFSFSKFLKGALFMDAGNIWTINTDDKREGSRFTGEWINEMAVAAGIGFRMDFDFFILRFDFGFPIRNPALPLGERWIFQDHSNFYAEISNFIKDNKDQGNIVTVSKLEYRPYRPQISFGIGYPF